MYTNKTLFHQYRRPLTYMFKKGKKNTLNLFLTFLKKYIFAAYTGGIKHVNFFFEKPTFEKQKIVKNLMSIFREKKNRTSTKICCVLFLWNFLQPILGNENFDIFWKNQLLKKETNNMNIRHEVFHDFVLKLILKSVGS